MDTNGHRMLRPDITFGSNIVLLLTAIYLILVGEILMHALNACRQSTALVDFSLGTDSPFGNEMSAL